MPKHFFFLIAAVLAETVGTTALQTSQQFTKFWPSVLVVIAYSLSFYLLALTLKFMPVGVMYAIWSGLGVVFIALIGKFFFGQHLDFPAILGMGLILAGVLVIHLFSETATHASTKP